MSVKNVGVKTCTKNLANQIQEYIKRIIRHDQVGFIPEMQVWFNKHVSINIIHHIHEMEDKNI